MSLYLSVVIISRDSDVLGLGVQTGISRFVVYGIEKESWVFVPGRKHLSLSNLVRGVLENHPVKNPNKRLLTLLLVAHQNLTVISFCWK